MTLPLLNHSSRWPEPRLVLMCGHFFAAFFSQSLVLIVVVGGVKGNRSKAYSSFIKRE
jgi:hypothetical protein